MLNYFKQFMHKFSKEQSKLPVIEATYSRIHPNMIWIIDDNSSTTSTSVFLTQDAMECFTYIYPNKCCSMAQFRDFVGIINEYLGDKLSSTGLINEIKDEQVKVGAPVPVFPVDWYIVAKIPIFEKPEQHTEVVKKVEESVAQVHPDDDNIDDYGNYIEGDYSYYSDDSDDSDDSYYSDDSDDSDNIDF